MLSEHESLIQKSLFGDVICPSERIGLGDAAAKVVGEILCLNPKIDKVSYIIYPPYGPSDQGGTGMYDGELVWIDANSFSPTEFRKLSTNTVSQTMVKYEPKNDEPFDLFCGVALSSAVTMQSGEIRHIPMMDFAEGLEADFEEDLHLVHNVVLSQKGYLLETGNSMHFYGINLMNDIQWQTFLQQSLTHFSHIVDVEFSRISLQREFSALRLFDYPPEKPYVPKVVDIIF